MIENMNKWKLVLYFSYSSAVLEYVLAYAQSASPMRRNGAKLNSDQ